MLRRILLAAVAGAMLCVPASAQTVDELIAKNAAARGGLDKIKAISSLRMVGKMTVGPGMDAPFALEMKRPMFVRTEFTIQGMTGIQAYDGSTGWAVMPFNGNPEPEAMSADDLKEAEEQADFDGPLVDYAAKGHKVELIGKEKVEGTDAYKLKVTLKGGDVRNIYLDAEYFLEIKTDGKRKMHGTEMEFESTMGDYKEVGGVMFPHAIEAGVKGSPQKQKLTFDKIEVNPALDDTRFKMPPPKKEEPKPKG
ncbi:MAG TPA: outer membrane lipoprotein-sorting protein [Candidatus Polarisedimenticolia bacterium]|nr:outer membrane lipoprotein-sorting protein [Candidatus Polarisedimenticolia bacterium]